MQGRKDARMQGRKDARTQGCKDARAQGREDARTQSFRRIIFLSLLKKPGSSPQRHREHGDFKLDFEKINFLTCKVEFS